MYQQKRVAAVVLARSASTRLKNKMLLPFLGSTVVETVIDRLKASRLIDHICLATTQEEADGAFEPLADKHDVGLVRGSVSDVVGRMVQAVRQSRPTPDIVVRACADNPLIMPSLVDEAIATLVGREADVVTPFEFNTYPFGLSMVVMTRACLERIDAEATAPTYREHVENYCFEHPRQFRIQYQKAPKAVQYPELSLTLDYASDYERLQRLGRHVVDRPLNEQLDAMGDHVRQGRTAVVLDAPDHAAEFLSCFAPLAASTLSLFCVSHGASPGTGTGVADGVEWVTWPALDGRIEQGEFDLVFSVSPPPPGRGAHPSRGWVTVTQSTDGRATRLGLAYVAATGDTSAGAQVFSEEHVPDFPESPAAFLLRVFPRVFPYFLAGPIPSADRFAAGYPPSQKQGDGGRLGFSCPEAVAFPLWIAVEVVGEDGTLVEPRWIERLLCDVRAFPATRVLLHSGSAREDHPHCLAIAHMLHARVGPGRLLNGPAGETKLSLPAITSLFEGLYISADGTLRHPPTAFHSSTRLGHISNCSVLQVWHDSRLKRARVDVLNALIDNASPRPR